MTETVGEKAKRISEPFSALIDELLMSGSLFPREQAILEQVEEIIDEVAKQQPPRPGANLLINCLQFTY